MEAYGVNEINGDALIKKGKGAPLIVLHGGPGLDHSYLVDGLIPITKYRTLIFYDQGSYLKSLNNRKNITVNTLVEELKTIIESLDGNYGFIAHSAGSLMLFEFLKHVPANLYPKEVVFITPLPLTSSTFKNDIEGLQKRIPEKTLDIIKELRSKPETCLESLNYIFPYYFYTGKIHDIKFKKFDCLLRTKLLNEIEGYNYTNLLNALPSKTIWITGEREVFTMDTSIPNWHIITQAAHFPFIENKNEFISIIKTFFSAE
jgi:proline iminopeptidase